MAPGLLLSLGVHQRSRHPKSSCNTSLGVKVAQAEYGFAGIQKSRFTDASLSEGLMQRAVEKKSDKRKMYDVEHR